MSSTIHRQTIALIGAGQVGSRHLQALVKCDFPVSLEIVEPNENARKVATERMAQVAKSSFVDPIRFVEAAELSSSIDLAIIATNSKDRLTALSGLLRRKRPQNIILEKVLFPSLDELRAADELLAENSARVWVNCPRRTSPGIRETREQLDPAHPFRMEVRGSGWGLACNSIHWVDLAAFLARETSYSVDTTKLDRTILESKRSGYIQFTGTLNITFRNGTELSLSCEAEGAPSFQASVFQNGLKIDVSETPLQSDLTQRFARQILMENRSDLTPYEDSSLLHRSLLSALLGHYSLLRGTPETSIPIT